ncbi:MSMEG_0569 family flavin-dependent oxidoreductase [soil metagenome]
MTVAIVGGGQAGLAMSYCLKRRRIEHIVLERHRVGHEWRTARWDSFCLVTPNWQCQLPGFPYDGDDPDGFMSRDEIVDYVERYADSFDPPLREGVTVTGLHCDGDDGFELETSDGAIMADQVVVATGGYHVPRIPRFAAALPVGIEQLHSSHYRNPRELPDGDVLVIGSGQSGCQIAEDLHLAGRRVHLCVGGATRTARFYRGRDVVAWLDDLGYYDLPVHEHKLGEDVREKANQYVTGRDGGHDIDLRRFAREGMRLYGRLAGLDGTVLSFERDLAHNLDAADAASEKIKDTIDGHIAEHQIETPVERRYEPVWRPEIEPRQLELSGSPIGSIVWCTGFDSDYSWVDAPAFDGRARPIHERGVTAVAGLYVVGLPWLYTWGSGRFSGIARDADHLADLIELGQDAAPVAALARRG